jgi:hypothetical protein
MTESDWHPEPHTVPPELAPDFQHADPPDIAPHRDPVMDTIRAELTPAEHVGVRIMDRLPADQWAALKTWLDRHSA